MEGDVEMDKEHESGEETMLKHEENKVLIDKEEYSVSARTTSRISVSLKLITTSFFSYISLLFLLNTLFLRTFSGKN